MTTRQAELINIMFSQHYNSATYKDAYSELMGACSDVLVQQTVTLSATGTSAPQPPSNTGTFPQPPSTQEPFGPELWNQRQAEAFQDQNKIIADQHRKIAALEKQIAEDKWHGDIKAGIDKGYREQANELVQANMEIIDALKRCGLRNEGSLVSNVICVIQLCAERGKKIDEFRKVVRDRNDEIEKMKKRIETMDRVSQTRQQFNETDRELIGNNDNEIEALKKRIEYKDSVITTLTARLDTINATVNGMKDLC